MAKPKRVSLWPETLKAPSRIDIRAFLQAQADDLKRLVDNTFDVVIEVRIVESVIAYNFTIVLPRRDYRYQLFSVRTIGGDFPARVVAPHLPEPQQVMPVADKDELEKQLRSMFRDPSTTKVILALADEERAALHEGYSPKPQ